MRAGLYYRVSSEEQVDGFSLDAQRRVLTEYCAAKGWPVVDSMPMRGSRRAGTRSRSGPHSSG